MQVGALEKQQLRQSVEALGLLVEPTIVAPPANDDQPVPDDWLATHKPPLFEACLVRCSHCDVC